jgi:hypothetical protein
MMGECGALRSSAVQHGILECERERKHDGDHMAYTQWGWLVSWPDVGNPRFWPRGSTRTDGGRIEFLRSRRMGMLA